MNTPNPHLSGAIEAPVAMGTAPYISPDYAREEKERLWLKVWQVACREEEIPKVGDYYTYEILDQSVIVTRTAEDEFTAYHNACRHRGRRLTKGCGHTTAGSGAYPARIRMCSTAKTGAARSTRRGCACAR